MEINFKELINNGAIILDVRNPDEFVGGHTDGAINIPLPELESNLNKLGDTNTTIITCCFSGKRAGMAESMLKQNNYNNVYCGGGWQDLQEKIK